MRAGNSGLLEMECHTKEQRVFIIEQYFKNNEKIKIMFFEQNQR